MKCILALIPVFIISNMPNIRKEKIVLICMLGMVDGDRNLFVRKGGASQKRLGNTVSITSMLESLSIFCSIILSLFHLIFIAMSFSMAISISDSKLFWVSEVFSLVFNSLS